MRHGETEWSKSGQHTGRTDIPLTANGEERAREAGRLLVAFEFVLTLASPLVRAQRTAERPMTAGKPRHTAALQGTAYAPAA